MSKPQDEDPNLYAYLRAVHSADGPADARVRVVLAVIALHRNQHTLLCCPGQRLIATESRMARNTVRSKLTDAEAAGWIERESVTSGGRFGAHTQYRLTIPADTDDSDNRVSRVDPLTSRETGSSLLTRSGCERVKSHRTVVHPRSEPERTERKRRNVSFAYAQETGPANGPDVRERRNMGNSGERVEPDSDTGLRARVAPLARPFGEQHVARWINWARKLGDTDRAERILVGLRSLRDQGALLHVKPGEPCTPGALDVLMDGQQLVHQAEDECWRQEERSRPRLDRQLQRISIPRSSANGKNARTVQAAL